MSRLTPRGRTINYGSRNRRKGGFIAGAGCLGLIVVGLVVAVLIGLFVVQYAKTEPVNITVREKESIPVEGGHEYRVYTDKGTFVMTDSIVHPRFDTADDYGALDEGSEYNCEAYGFRVPLLSSFQNLINCKPVAG